MRIRLLVLGASVMLLLSPGRAWSASAPFTISSFSATAAPGDTVVVSGSGCPPSGSLPTPVPLYLRLTPPTGGNAWAPAFIGPNVGIFSTAQLIPGETDVPVVPALDGTFTATITVPADAPALDGYTVRGLCLTVLQAGDGPNGFSQASLDASAAQAGSLDVVAPVTTTTTTTTIGRPATSEVPAIVVRPSFTG